VKTNKDRTEGRVVKPLILYSTRGFYIANILKKEVSRNDVCNFTRFYYEVIIHYYNKIKVKSRISEVTKRIFGDKESKLLWNKSFYHTN